MAEIINFEKLTIKNIVNKQLGFSQLEFEILLTVIRYLYAYMEKELDDPIDEIHPHASIEELFGGNRERFAHAFVELLKYWELDSITWNEIPLNKGFETFKKVEDLCLFVEEKLMKKN